MLPWAIFHHGVAMRSLRSVLIILYAFVGGSMILGSLMQLRYVHLSYLSNPALLLPTAFLPITSCIFLLAALSYWRRWPSVRAWCLVVGFWNTLVAAFFTYFFWTYTHDSFGSALASQSLLFGLGAVSLVAFWRWNPVAEHKTHDPSVIAARTGDGTISFLNRIHLFADATLFWFIYIAWSNWALNRGLSRPGFIAGTLDLVVAAIISVTVHELGHTLCGLSLGQKLLAFLAGPFQWHFSRGYWRFSFNPVGLLTAGGGTATVPQHVNEPEWRDLCMVAAGPLASLIAGIGGICLSLCLIDTPYEDLWFPLAMFGSISLQAAVINLVPLRTAAGYSDGARLLQILRGGVWRELDRAFRTCKATLVTQIRPRDYDIDALHRVIAANLVPAPQQFFLHLIANSYYLDHDAFAQAHNEILAAAALYSDCAASISAELHTSFIIGEALSRRDPAQARLWWDRMEAKKPTWFNGDYWMARASLCWLEGNREESHSAWSKAHDYLATMPHTGTYEFDCDILTTLRRIIQAESPIAQHSASSLTETVFA